MGGLAGADVHAIAILFARDDAEHARATGVHDELVARCDGVRSAIVSGFERVAAVQLRTRSLRVPGQVLAAGDRGLG